MPEPDKIISLREAAERVGVNRATIYRWQRVGNFPLAVRLSDHRIGFRESSVNDWISSRPEART